MAFCSNCGSPISGKFCTACGAPPLTAVPSTPEPQAERPPVPVATAASIVARDIPFKLLHSRMLFVALYLLAAVPTYILPYFGSNSTIMNATGAAMGLGAQPTFWFHVLALYTLFAITWLRGAYTGRSWIAIFPFFAALFDLVPLLNWVFLIPTAFHVTAMVMGVKGEIVPEANPTAGRMRLIVASAGFVLLAVLAFVKANAYFENAKRGPSWEKPNAQQQPSLQSLRASCDSDIRYACIWIGEMISSTCKKSDQCADSITSTLRGNNLTFITDDNNPPYAANDKFYRPGCIGYRSDIGGTKEGAVELAKLLGETQYYAAGDHDVTDATCSVSGFKYNVMRR
jgi:hypothetical protein